MFLNPKAEDVTRLLRTAHTIAVVGLSPDRTRPSHGVAKALQRFGYRIVPVNPFAEFILGEPAVASLEQVAAVLGPDEQFDIVDVFRRGERGLEHRLCGRDEQRWPMWVDAYRVFVAAHCPDPVRLRR